MPLIKRSAKLSFLGSSHAARHLAAAARERGFETLEPEKADVVFVSEDTPIDDSGRRNQLPIWEMLAEAVSYKPQCLVLTSQVEPGFTREAVRHHRREIYCQTELLRMRDAGERARHPEMLIVGCRHPRPYRGWPPPVGDGAYLEYLRSFDCPILAMSWEEAEFAKIAINTALAMQVDYANRMKAACDQIGANWDVIKEAVHLDRRIGAEAYLDPGRWQDSLHLLRDRVTLEKIELAIAGIAPAPAVLAQG